jgi:hypothetical protein
LNSLKKIISLSAFQIILSLLTIVICFLFFLQGDLIHTAFSSYAYLQGHIKDFYEYNKLYLGGNDYLPTLYIIFAIWNTPLHFLGITSYPTPEVFTGLNWNLVMQSPIAIEIAWWKTLLALFYIGSVLVIHKIADLIESPHKTKTSLVSTLFATSPFVIFSVFIFSGYDVISVFFTLLGFYYYLKKDIKRFIFFFAIAISCKYFAAILFFPLILMIEKKPLHIIKLTTLGTLAVALGLCFYWRSQIFREEIFNLMLYKIKGNAPRDITLSEQLSLAISLVRFSFAGLYIATCIHIFFKKFRSKTEWQKYAVFMSLFSYALMFLSVKWHPQWSIIITPFISLSYLFIKNKRLLSVFEILAMFSFVCAAVIMHKFNVDVSMMTHSILKNALPQVLIINADLILGNESLWKYASILIFDFYLFLPLLLLFYESQKPNQIKITTPSETLITNRLVLGISFLVIPSFICLFMPESWAHFINPDALIRLKSH